MVITNLILYFQMPIHSKKIAVKIHSINILAFEFFNEKLPFSEAKLACSSKNGELALPTSKNVQYQITSAMKHGASTNSTALLAPDEKAWINIELTPENKATSHLIYSDYRSGEPSSPEESCVAMEINTDGNEWWDETCDTPNSYICQFTSKLTNYKKQNINRVERDIWLTQKTSLSVYFFQQYTKFKILSLV